MPAKLMLHGGAEPTTLADLYNLPTVEGTRSWQPMPHVEVRGLIRDQLDRAGYRVGREQFGLSKDGRRCFATMELENLAINEEVGFSLAWRNSTDKSLAAALAAGINPFNCDNLAISGDVVVFAKHTANVHANLPARMGQALAVLPQWRDMQARMIEELRDIYVCDKEAHDVMVDAAANGVLAWNRIGKVYDLWHCRAEDQPDTYHDPTAWSLLNCFTEANKAYHASANPHEGGRRSAILTDLLTDRYRLQTPTEFQRQLEAN